MVDVLIRNGTVYNGNGGEPFPTFRTLKTNKITILNGAAKESNYLQSDRC